MITAEKKSGIILASIAAIEGSWVAFNWIRSGDRFVGYMGFAAGKSGSMAGWIAAIVVAALFVALAIRLPSVRANLFAPTFLKLLGLAVAVSAGILEEVIFRKLLMDALAARAFGVTTQIAASALLFGLAHGVWGLFGRSVRAAAGATIATALLGLGLAIVYIAAGRSVAPCIVAHFLINALVEPGLVLAASRGEMARR